VRSEVGKGNSQVFCDIIMSTGKFLSRVCRILLLQGRAAKRTLKIKTLLYFEMLAATIRHGLTSQRNWIFSNMALRTQNVSSVYVLEYWNCNDFTAL